MEETWPPPAWLGREDSNLRVAESKSAALPLGYAPSAFHAGRAPDTERRAYGLARNLSSLGKNP